jgi:hypothetical protein
MVDGRTPLALMVRNIARIVPPPHVRITSHWRIEVLNSAEKLKFLVGSQMPDKRIIDRACMRRDIAQRSVFGLYAALRAINRVHCASGLKFT